VVAACDEELLGQKLVDGKLRLHVNPDFYDGIAGDEETLEAYLRTSTIANLVGRRTVDVAIKLGYVQPQNVLLIGGVPHAQWALML
jgi:uncharacterized protein